MSKLQDFKKIDNFLQVHEVLFEYKIDELRLRLRETESFLTELRDTHRKALADLVGIPEQCMDDIPNYWECELSPTQYCIYDLREVDPYDNCIFCGDSLERK